jgi:glycosyltransferase involved in cell wall biosynthesis
MIIGIDCRMYSTKFTGIGKYTKQLVENLSQIDSENQYYLYFNQEEFNNFKPPAPNFKKFEINAPHYSLKEQTTFALALYQTRPDVMHFTHFNSPACYIRKQVTTIHDLTLHFYPGQKYTKPLQRLAYKTVFQASLLKSNTIITPTKHTQKDLLKLYPSTKNKTTTIYEGTDSLFNNFNPSSDSKPEFELPENYILYTGNWREHKNLNNLISAFEILKNQYNYPGKLIITGNSSSGEQSLQGRIQKLVDQDLIITPGLIPENQLPYLYYKADCYVFPSFYEGFGLPVLEAFATKTPTVVSNSSCLEEVGQKGVLTFNPLDPQEMAIKINQAITSPETRSQLIQNGSERLKDFSFKTMAQETLKVYQKAYK